MNKIICISLGIVLLLVILYSINKETFQTKVKIQEDTEFNDLFNVEGFDGHSNESNLNTFLESENNENHNENNTQAGCDLGQYVKRSDMERSARAATRKYCPVEPDYNPNDYVKKTEILSDSVLKEQCPPIPDMKDYVLKSTIPPIQQCPPCICPKVKVSAGLCKYADCSLEECQKKVKCPEVKPCLTDDVRVCPSIKIPDLKELEDKFDIVKHVNNLKDRNDTRSKDKLEKLRKALGMESFIGSMNFKERFEDFSEEEEESIIDNSLQVNSKTFNNSKTLNIINPTGKSNTSLPPSSLVGNVNMFEEEEETTNIGTVNENVEQEINRINNLNNMNNMNNINNMNNMNNTNLSNEILNILRDIKNNNASLVQEEEQTALHLNEDLINKPTPFNVLEVSPSQKYDSECKPMKYRDRFNNYGLLGSVYN